MTDASEWWLLVPAPLRELPADLAATLGVVGLAICSVFLPVINETPLRIGVGLLFVLFIPGYAFIAALFPEHGTLSEEENEKSLGAEEEEDAESDRLTPSSLRNGGIDGIERVALSFGLSIALVPLIGLILNFTPWGIRLVPIMIALSGFTAGCVAVAARRRWALPEEEQFRVPYQQWYHGARTELFEPDSKADAALNVVLVLSIVLATASVAYAVAVPQQGETFTEFYLLTENESGGLVADDYPTNFTVSESRPVTIGIGNQEHAETDYTVVVQLQRVEQQQAGNDTTLSVQNRQELDRFSTQLGHNETWLQSYEITPRMSGQNLRLAVLLYQDSPPAQPTIENSYRETHLWVNVTEAAVESP